VIIVAAAAAAGSNQLMASNVLHLMMAAVAHLDLGVPA
jgi:hypothetical protein